MEQPIIFEDDIHLGKNIMIMNGEEWANHDQFDAVVNGVLHTIKMNTKIIVFCALNLLENRKILSNHHNVNCRNYHDLSEYMTSKYYAFKQHDTVTIVAFDITEEHLGESSSEYDKLLVKFFFEDIYRNSSHYKFNDNNLLRLIGNYAFEINIKHDGVLIEVHNPFLPEADIKTYSYNIKSLKLRKRFLDLRKDLHNINNGKEILGKIYTSIDHKNYSSTLISELNDIL